MSTVLAVPETKELETRADGLLARVKGLEVVDLAGAEEAAEYARLGAAMEQEIKALMDPICAAAHVAHQTATRKRGELLLIPSQIKRVAADKATAWQREQERLRRAEEERLRREREEAERAERERVAAAEEKLRKEAEDRQLEAAAQAEARGDTAAAAQILAAPVEAPTVQARPVFTPPPTVAAPPKLAGLTSRTDWDFEIVDASRIPREYLIPDEVAIRKVVRAMKGRTLIPGIRPVEKPVSSVRA